MTCFNQSETTRPSQRSTVELNELGERRGRIARRNSMQMPGRLRCHQTTMTIALAMSAPVACNSQRPSQNAPDSRQAAGPASSHPQTQESTLTCSFRGTVRSVGIAQGKSVKAFVVGLDARWIVCVRVDQQHQPLPGVAEGQEVNFLVHSPVRLFDAAHDEIIGTAYEFRLEGRRQAEGVPIFHMQATRAHEP
ncbi:MAG: hypothetical protein HUU22_18635 [Phycisphaerae bacterium]|nr:hypothetical protein [Phycisphaerae bacterium]NUQ48034.1 hypothetical protein [Phycisphaerae bacterium]